MRLALRCVALAALGLASTAAFGADPRELAGEVPARDLSVLRVDADLGAVEIRAGAADQIAWRVRVEERDGSLASRKRAARAVAAARVEPAIADRRLTLDLTFAGADVDEDDVEEHWEITLPARLALDAELGIGELVIAGVAGGVEAEVGIGDLSVDVPRGTVDAKLSIGDLEIVSATDSPGEISVRVSLGDVRLEVRGERIEAERGFGLGNSIGMGGAGRDHITARVRVGDARVAVK